MTVAAVQKRKLEEEDVLVVQVVQHVKTVADASIAIAEELVVFAQGVK